MNIISPNENIEKKDLPSNSQPNHDLKKAHTLILPFPIMIWRISLVFGVLLCSSYTIIVHLCEKDGKLPFSSFAVILMIELTKLLLSIIMFTYEIYQSDFNNDSFKCVSLKQTIYQEFYPTTLLENTSSVSAIPPLEYKQIIITIFPYTIPAVLYAFNNNLGLHIQLEMDPATYQILSNFKILSTAILFRLIIKQRITPIQWFALLLLLTAGIVHSLGNFDTQKAFIPSSLSTTSKNNVSSVIHQVSSSIRITTKGIIMVFIYCTISGLSGVYTEHVMKKHATMNIHLQNFLLYTFGSILNGIVFIFEEYQKDVSDDSFHLFRGFDYMTWLLISTQSVFGIFMGFVLKYASNIHRLFIISLAMIVTTIFAVLLFNLHLNGIILTSIILVCTSLYLYYG